MKIKSTLLFFGEVLKIVVLALVIVIPIRYFIFQPFIVKGVSMEPTFHNGDYLIIDEFSYYFREPQRGEVIVFRYPENLSEKFIKRIIGLPGEKIELRGSQIIIAGQSGEEIVLDESDYLTSSDLLGDKEFVLGKGEYFVLGDNRSHSFDSRNWGSLARGDIIGKVAFRAFPPTAMAYFSAPDYKAPEF